MRPRVRTAPPSGRITPLMSFSRVDFPDPLSPMSPIDSPCSTVNDTSSSARNVLLISCPRAEATTICLRVRWKRNVNFLLTWSTTMDSCISEALGELGLEPVEHPLARHEEHHADRDHDEAPEVQVVRHRSRTGAGRVALAGRDPEGLLQQQHRLG